MLLGAGSDAAKLRRDLLDTDLAGRPILIADPITAMVDDYKGCSRSDGELSGTLNGQVGTGQLQNNVNASQNKPKWQSFDAEQCWPYLSAQPSKVKIMHFLFQKAIDLIHPARSVTQLQRSAEEQCAADQAAHQLTLYHFRSCPYCNRVRRAAHRLNIPMPLRDIHAEAAAYQTLVTEGGRQTVPCLYIGDRNNGKWLYESADIIDYLNQRFAPARDTQ